MEEMIVIQAYKDSVLLETFKLSLYEWYDGDVEIIDSDEYRKNKGVNKIIGTTYLNDNQTIDTRFITMYDNRGNIISSDEFNNELDLIKSSLMCSDYNNIIGFYEITFFVEKEFNVEIKIECKNQQAKCDIYTLLYEQNEDEWVLINESKKEEYMNDSNKGFLKNNKKFKVNLNKNYHAEVIFCVFENNSLVEKIKIVSKDFYSSIKI